MVDLGSLPRADAERIADAMQHIVDTGPCGYYVLAELLPVIRRHAKRGNRYAQAVIDRFEACTGHALPPDGRLPPLH